MLDGKPIVNRIAPIDALLSNTITWSWNGVQQYGYEVSLLNANGVQIYTSGAITSFLKEYTIPPNILTNGYQFMVKVRVYDYYEEWSDWSYVQSFYALKTPTFKFADTMEWEWGNGRYTLKGTSLHAVVEYVQEDYEILQSYSFILYNAGGMVIASSGTLYDDYDISYTFGNLNNYSVYYIQCVGMTRLGMKCDTGKVQFIVKAENPEEYTRLYVNNKYEDGYIEYSTNIICIQYNGNEEFEYDDNTWINLVEKPLYYDKNFAIDGDFTLWIKGYDMYKSTDYLTLSDGVNSIVVSGYIYDDGQVRFKATASNGLDKYIIYSNSVTFTQSDVVILCLQRKNNLYGLYVSVDTQLENYVHFWLGEKRPNLRDCIEYDKWVSDSEPDTEELITAPYMDVYPDHLQYIEDAKSEEEPEDPRIYLVWTGGDYDLFITDDTEEDNG